MPLLPLALISMVIHLPPPLLMAPPTATIQHLQPELDDHAKRVDGRRESWLDYLS